MKAFAKLTTMLTLVAVLATTVFAQAPTTTTGAPKTGAAVKGYTRKTKSGKIITVKGYTRGAKTPAAGKMTTVKGYTRKSKSGKMVTVKGYTRKAPASKSKATPKM